MKIGILVGILTEVYTKSEVLKMQSRISYLIYSQAYDGWLNKMADGIVQDMFKGIYFTTLEDAEHWMKGIYAPKDSENYEIQRTKTTIEVDVECAKRVTAL